MKAARVKKGSVVWNKRFRTWNFLWIQDGRRRSKVIGTLQDYRTKQAATQAAEALRCFVDQPADGAVPTVRYLVEEFRREKMPERFSTRLGYEAWLYCGCLSQIVPLELSKSLGLLHETLYCLACRKSDFWLRRLLRRIVRRTRRNFLSDWAQAVKLMHYRSG